MSEMKTEFVDFFETPISIGDTLFDFKINNAVPKTWKVRKREDGLIYCEGKVDNQPKYIGLNDLLNNPLVAIRVVNLDNTQKQDEQI